MKYIFEFWGWFDGDGFYDENGATDSFFLKLFLFPKTSEILVWKSGYSWVL